MNARSTIPFVSSCICAISREVLRKVIKRPVPVYYCDVYRISHEAKGVSHGKEDAAVLSVHTCFTGEFLCEIKSHTKTLTLTFMQRKVSRKVKVLMLPLVRSHSSTGVIGENSFYRFTLQDISL